MYDRATAIAYAHTWAYQRNPRYYDFSALGGDCTNFISQCIHAGGAAMHYARPNGWYYRTTNDRAAAWTGVRFLYEFLTKNSGVGAFADEIPLDSVQPGDVIQLSFVPGQFGHSLFVVDVAPDDGQTPMESRIYIATHTDDSDNRPLDSYFYRVARALHIGAR